MKICISEIFFLYEIVIEIENIDFYGRIIGRISFLILVEEGSFGYDVKFDKKGRLLFI